MASATRRLLEPVEDALEIPCRSRSLHPGGNALVPRVLRHAVESGAVHHDHAHAALLRRPRQLARAVVAARLVEIDLSHDRRFLAQAAGHCMEAVH
jgi:hypothetical protein